MYLYRVGASMWSAKWWCLLLLLLSVAGGIYLTYDVSFSHATVRPRRLSFGVAQTDLLINSRDSPLADSAVLTEDIDTLANDIAQMVGSGTALSPVAQALHIPETDIYAQSQLVGNVSLFSAEADEAQRGNQLVGAGRHYSILARVDQSSFVVQIFTQAPTAEKAELMANLSASALSRYIAQIGASERIPLRRRVILQQITPTTGGVVDSSLPQEAAVLLSAVFFIFSTTALLTIRRWRRRAKHRTTPPGLARSEPSR